jgi:predicted transcriptional regulator
MGAIQLRDEVQRVIERQVADGRATSAVAFVEEAVLRMIEDMSLEDEEIRKAVEAGIADIDAGRFTTVATEDDNRHLHDRLMARLRASLAPKG